MKNLLMNALGKVKENSSGVPLRVLRCCMVLLVAIVTTTSVWGAGIYLEYPNNTKNYDGNTITINLNPSSLPVSGSTSMNLKNDAGWTTSDYGSYGHVYATISGSYTPANVSFLTNSASDGAFNCDDNTDPCLDFYKQYIYNNQYWNTSFSLGYWFDAAGTYPANIAIRQRNYNDDANLQTATVTVRYVVTFNGHTITYNLTGLEHASTSNPTGVADGTTSFTAHFNYLDGYTGTVTGTVKIGDWSYDVTYNIGSGDADYSYGTLSYNAGAIDDDVIVTLEAAQDCTTPLAKPTNLTASNITPTSVDLSWNAVANAESYTLEVTTYPGNDYYKKVTGLTSTSYSITDLDQGENVDYIWSVDAIGSGDYCNSGEIETFTTPTCVMLSAPTNLTVTENHLKDGVAIHGRTRLGWDRVTNNNGYTISIYRDGVFVTDVERDANTEYYINTFGVGTWSWKIRTKGDGVSYCTGNTTDGADWCVGTDLTSVSPTGLNVVATSTSTVMVSWNAVSNAEKYYLTFTNMSTSASTSTNTANLYKNVNSVSTGTTFKVDLTAKNACDDSYATQTASTTFTLYNVTFNMQGYGDAIDPVGAVSGATISAPTDPTTTDYTFGGWYKESECEHIWDFANDAVDGNTVLYAKWEPKSYTLSFDANGGTGTMTPENRLYGSTASLPSNSFTYAGHVFVGWATTDSGEKAYNNGADYTMGSGNATLYAKWREATYSDYQFSCADLSLTAVPGNPVVLMTSTAGQWVRSHDSIHVYGTGLSANQPIVFTTGDADKFVVKNYKYEDISTDASGVVDKYVYVFYKPASDATSDGIESFSTLGASAGGTKPRSAKLTTHTFMGRHIPQDFVIAAKMGKGWYALPADMTVTGVFEPVQIAVDNVTNPTTAYCNMNSIYNLYGTGYTTINTSGTSGNLRTGNGGDQVKFGMPNNGTVNAALWANNAKNSTEIGRNGTTLATNQIGANYWWNVALKSGISTVSTPADIIYNISNNQNGRMLKLWAAADGGPKWGLYEAGTGIQDIRLLPAEEMDALELSVMEWGTNEIAIKYEGIAESVTGAQIAGNDVTATMSDIGGDLKRISGLTGLTSYPGEELLIQMTEGSTLKQTVLQIPYIVTSSTTVITLRDMTGETSETAKNAVTRTIDLVIRSGGHVNATSETGNTAAGVFKDIYVYPGGKLELSANDLGAKNVYLRGGFSWLGSPEFGLPHMKVADGKKIPGIGGTGCGVYYDLYLNSDIYYMTALPKDVALSDITNEENTTDFKAWIKYYNGGNRAGVNTDKPWVSVTSGSLMRGVGYEIAIKKRNGRPYGILRFPLLKATTWSNETECNPDVTAWGIRNEGVTANNAGWNLVGNPFMTAFHNSADDKIVNYGFTKHGDPWDGTYDWDKSGDEENIKYFTIPEYTYEDWRDVRSIGATLEAFYPFAVQVKQDGRLAFAPANRELKPSILRQKMAEREVMVDFELKDANGKTDVAGLTICNDYSAAFDSEDKEKTIKSNSYLKVYTMVGEYRTAFNSLPEADAAQPIPVGYIAPSAGNYTFALLEDGDYSTLEHLWLTDYETSKTVDLLTENYTFETAAGETNTRFALNAILKAESVTTEIGDIEGADVLNMSVYGGNKHLVVRGLPSGADVWVYDAAGKLVATWTNVSDASVQTDVPASGVYSVRAIHNNTAVTKRAIVK